MQIEIITAGKMIKLIFLLCDLNDLLNSATGLIQIT